MTTKRPIHSIKRGGLEAAIWTNEAKDGAIFYRVTFTRFYRGTNGKPANSSSFGSRSLPDLILASEAESWMLAQEASQTSTEATADA